MRKLALSDKILLKVDKAARYIGGEVNSVMKDKNEIDIRFAMCFPDVYEIGMSNLGMMILYNMFNQRYLHWSPRSRSVILISLGSLLVMKCVIPISSRYWISAGFR